MSNRSAGEEAFAQVFQFKSIVPTEDHDELRDFFYKFRFNYDEAQEYFAILEQAHDMDAFAKSELLFRVYAMALQCFALSMRRLTDHLGNRSLQKLIPKIIAPELMKKELKRIKDIHNHFSFYLNKSVAHQDTFSVKEALESFPETDVIKQDMKHLKDLYLKLVRELCMSYVGMNREPHDFRDEFNKLA